MSARLPSSPTSIRTRSTSIRRTSPRASPRERRRSCPSISSAGPRRSRSSRELGLPLIEDAAQAFGARGRRADRRLLDLQLLPDEEPLRARRRRARDLHRRRGGGARPHAPLPRLAGQAHVRASRDELPAGRDPGRGAARLPPASSTGWNDARGARRPRATASSGSASSSSCPPTSPVTSTTCSSSARRSATRSAAALDRGADRERRRTTCRRSTSSPRSVPRLLRGRPAGDRARRGARTSRCRCGPGSRPSSRSGSSRPCARRSACRPSDEVPGQQAPALAGRRRRGPRRGRVGPRLVRPLRGRHAARVLRPVPRVGRRRARRRRSRSRSSSPSASTTAGGATSRRGTCGARCVASRRPSVAVFLVFTLLDFHPAESPARDLDRRHAAPARAS